MLQVKFVFDDAHRAYYRQGGEWREVGHVETRKTAVGGTYVMPKVLLEGFRVWHRPGMDGVKMPSPRKKPAVNKYKPAVPKNKPAPPKEKPAVPEKKPAVTE